MGQIYNDLEDDLFREFKPTTKQSIEDISLDAEEKEKVVFNLSGTTKSKVIDLRTDFSDFSNHVFFGSAYSAVNFAVNRILDYPSDGDLKAVNEWKDLNSGYENWLFEQWPKQEGHLYHSSGAVNSLAQVTDYEGIINFGTGSFSIEAIIDPREINSSTYPIVSIADAVTPITKNIIFSIISSSAPSLSTAINGDDFTAQLNFDYSNYFGEPHHVAFSWASDGSIGNYKFYIDGEVVSSGSDAAGTITLQTPIISVGSVEFPSFGSFFFSGSIDEVRIWASDRSSELIKKNHNRTIYANPSGSLKAYYKFNDLWMTSSNKVLDYSGNGLHLDIENAFITSGSLAGWFADGGDLVLDLRNDDVLNLIEDQQQSGSNYDAENPNYIFELIPSFLLDHPDSDEMKRFLLLLARHWDRLKLYIENLSNVYKTIPASENDTPDELLNLVAKDSGIDIGGIFSNSDPLQYFYGEDVLASGRLDASLEDVGARLKRNIVNNLIYLYKTKSTRESILAALRAIGLDESLISVNEYSILSGGIQTKWEPKVVERKVLNFWENGGQYVELSSSAFSNTDPRTYQFRVLFNSGSYADTSILTASVFRIDTGTSSGSRAMYADFIRENENSSRAYLSVHHSASAGTQQILSSSLFDIFDDNWINVNIGRDVSDTEISYAISSVDTRGEFIFNLSGTSDVSSMYQPSDATVRLGSVVGEPFYGNLQEVRVWNKTLENEQIEYHAKDFESVALSNFFDELEGNNTLLSHLKLNDFISSASGNGTLHDFVDGNSGSSYVGFSTSSNQNFPGVFIDKLEPSSTYDFTVDNDKIRIKDGEFTKNDINEDLQYLSVDFSPVSELNKEIIRWFGNIDKFSNIIGYPYLKYRDEITSINAYRNKFFSERTENSIDYSSYFNIIKWFDLNFSYFLKQLIPLEMASSISNLVVEPNLFEFNKVKQVFPYSDTQNSYSVSASISNISTVEAEASGFEISLADPGRFGAAVSASAFVSEDVYLVYDEGLGANYDMLEERSALTDFMDDNETNAAPDGYGNGFYNQVISCSNYEKNVLNINPEYEIGEALLLTSSQGTPQNSFFTSSFSGVQDARWLWYDRVDYLSRAGNSEVAHGPEYDFGIGYGGAFGQLYAINKKSLVGGLPPIGAVSRANHIGEQTVKNSFQFDKYVITNAPKEEKKVAVMWPLNEVGEIFSWPEGGSVEHLTSWGPVVELDGFTSLFVEARGFCNINFAGDEVTELFSLIFKFQFFDEEMASTGYEMVLSSSIATDNAATTSLPHQYTINVEADFDGPTASFLSTFERGLPQTKYMRTRLEVFNSNAGSSGGSCRLLVRGILSNKEQSGDILRIRQT